MEDHTLVLFNAITKFVQSLNECYGEQQKSLKLYNRLVEKTTIIHDGPIQKHITAFTDFCKSNASAISIQDASQLETYKITYSERVFINMKQIFSIASRSEQQTIWAHLLNLSAKIEPESEFSSNAKKLLKKTLKAEKDTSKEETFLNDIIGKVENNVTATDNPMQAVSSVMSSGIFTDLIGTMTSGLNNGELDLTKLMGTVNGMVNNLAEKTDMPPEMSGMMEQMTGMMNQLNTMQNGGKLSKSQKKRLKKKMKKQQKMMESQNSNVEITEEPVVVEEPAVVDTENEVVQEESVITENEVAQEETTTTLEIEETD